MISREREEVITQLMMIEKKANRYMLDKFSNSLDDEGERRLSDLMQKRLALKEVLKKITAES